MDSLLIQYKWYLYKKRDTRGEDGGVITGAEIGVTRLPPKEYQGLPTTNYQKLEKQGFSPTDVSMTLANTAFGILASKNHKRINAVALGAQFVGVCYGSPKKQRRWASTSWSEE